MSKKELVLGDSYGKLHIGEFAGAIAITPVAGKIGDAIALDRNQAHLLYLYLKERFEPK